MVQGKGSLILLFGLTIVFVVSRGDIPTEDKDVIDRVTGHFYLMHDQYDGVKRLSKRDIQGIRGYQHVKLDLGLRHGSIEMRLEPGTVWTPESTVYVRGGAARDKEAMAVPVQIDPGCFLAGALSSHEGTASFSHCGGLRGFVQTPDVEYLVEQPARRNTSHFSEVIVTLLQRTTGDDDNINKNMNNDEDAGYTDQYYGIDENDSNFHYSNGEHDESSDDEYDDNGIGKMQREETLFYNQAASDTDATEEAAQTAAHIRYKRAPSVKPIAAEIAVYVDRNMVNYLRKQGISTIQQITEFMITKWNAVARVYGNATKVGVKLDIQLKRVEVWWKNPVFYRPVQKDPNLGKHLSVFCNYTRGDDGDHRMLYTHGVGGRVMGMAWVGSICRAKTACSVVRSRKRSSVLTEMHELGHNFGFRHDPQMGCSKPYGFMGWRNSNFNECYRKRLLNSIKRKSTRCLRQRNVRVPKLNKG